ncbi:lipoprotein-releasing ABC transporter permease subunit [Alteromonas oceanisediminis]|uniref:lipoprotein-releasing ABC transporter permease subunit n=1 Tax=Alteromonas oceanisediminis TaxID=2836180 RepID=UPI001BD998DE|nr:lipoprotein-releasing ABC transporter permease subunit [Alteromonas oceanisediminis]MBT0587219.1 lipoprotein-releasing ABC transporter permease subunit [Alteromonas oceanisediminis]
MIFSSLPLTIALRFRKSKQSQGYVSFISLSSTFGIGLGCCVLILLLSVMNGFERELEQRLLALIPHGELYAVSPDGIENWQVEATQLSELASVKSVQPYATLTGMLQQADKMKAIELTALDPQYAAQNRLFDYLDDTTIAQFSRDPRALILGKGIMQQLSLQQGDKVQLLIPSITDDLSFKAPQSVWLNVVGQVSIGGELDNQLGFVPLSLVADELSIDHGAQGLRFELVEPFNARAVMREIGYSFQQAVFMSDWTRTQGHLYQDIQLVRVIIYIALILVIAVACFNIISGLVMTVEEKRSAVAILKTMGMNNRAIKVVFVLQGLFNGVLGIFAGSLLGVILALNLSDWIRALEQTLGVSLLSGDIYFVDFLPSQLEWLDVVVTVSVALVLCVWATLYPAAKAAKIQPAEALSH